MTSSYNEVTEGVADIGHAPLRGTLPARRPRTARKIHIAGTARLLSTALQYSTFLEHVGDLLLETKYVTSIDHSSLFSATKHLQRGGLT